MVNDLYTLNYNDGRGTFLTQKLLLSPNLVFHYNYTMQHVVWQPSFKLFISPLYIQTKQDCSVRFNNCQNPPSHRKGNRTCILQLHLVLIRSLWSVDPGWSHSLSAPTTSIWLLSFIYSAGPGARGVPALHTSPISEGFLWLDEYLMSEGALRRECPCFSHYDIITTR